MQIKSATGREFNIKEFFNESKYIKSITIFYIPVFLIMFLDMSSWFANIWFTIILIVGMSIYLYNILDYNEGSWAKYLLSVFLFIALTAPITLIPLKNEYNTAERIDESIPITENFDILFNESYNLIIVNLIESKLTLAYDFDGSSTYNKIKAGILEGSLTISKKKVKDWHDDEPEINYYVGGYRLR